MNIWSEFYFTSELPLLHTISYVVSNKNIILNYTERKFFFRKVVVSTNLT